MAKRTFSSRPAWFLLIVVLLMAACTRDSLPRRLELLIEPLGAKLALDGTTGTWSNGDSVLVNGQRVAILRSGGHAYVENVPTADVYRAFFPTSLTESNNTDNVTVILPREYSYRTDATGQLISLPLAARASGEGPLPFKHLTGAICFTLQNNRTTAITVDRITVESDYYRLSSSRSIDLTNLTLLAPDSIGLSDADRRVDITFTHQSLTIPSGESRQVVIPVAPVGVRNHFTITVSSHNQGTRYIYSRTQPTGGALARNQMAYATVVIDNSLTARSPFLGKGTRDLPYLISTPTDFLLMAEAISSQWNDTASRRYNTLCYSISNDINLAGYSINPIRGYTTGTFDGGGHTLSNLTIISHGTSNNDTCALFQRVANATIKNLTLDHLTLSHNNNSTNFLLAGFCGEIQKDTLSSCKVTNLHLNISVSNHPTTYFGGIAARGKKSNILSDCTVDISPLIIFPQSLHYGNIIGRLSDGSNDDFTVNITNCDATNASLSLESTSTINFGGIVGFLETEKLTLNGCDFYGNGSITTTTTIRAGGLVGYHNTASSPKVMTISNCTVSGTITTQASSNNYAVYVGYFLPPSYISYGSGNSSDGFTIGPASK